MSVILIDVDENHADYLHDESRREGQAEKIAFPKSTDEVRETLAVAAESNWPVTIQGGRTGITGGCVPESGLILNLSRMNIISPVDGDLMAVQPGATLADIRLAIEGSGLFFPSDLTETTASIGGMVANNASGARSFHYGSIRNWIHSLEVVLADGKTTVVERGVHKANGRSFQLGHIEGVFPEISAPEVKNAAGYFIRPDMDLVDLFIGAEGTLGIVTEITLQLLPEPDLINGLIAFFPDEDTALNFVQFLRTTSPVLPTAIEFFDNRALELLRRMKVENGGFADLPALNPAFHTAIYFEVEGDVPAAVVERADEAVDCWFAEGKRELDTLKNFRHAIPESVNMLISERKKTIPDLTKLGTDMSVPDDQLENVMRMYHNGLTATGLEYVIFGHIGNNHVHVNILPHSMAEYRKGKALYLDWAKQVVEWGGSVSAEHGIGKNKTEFLQLMCGAEGLEQMKELKELFDPVNRLNPGNLFAGRKI